METIIGDYIGTVIKIHSHPRSPLRTREFLKVVSALIPASLPPMLVTFWGVEGSNLQS